MSRKARLQSSTGIYHVLIRSIADLDLFTDQEDRDYYIQILRDLELRGYCKLYAYALFPTHVHLLIREGYNEPIGSIMKRLASAYSYFFNVKYDHYGPIYLDRFKSNPVETRDYYLKVLDHIASQPTEAKDICTHTIPNGLVKPYEETGGLRNEQGSTKKAGPYENSGEALRGASPSCEALRGEALRGETLRSEALRGVRPSSSFPPLLDYRERSKRLTDSRLLAFLQQNFGFTNICEFLQREKGEQQEVIKAAKNVGGSIRQIVRLTGSPYQSVFQIK